MLINLSEKQVEVIEKALDLFIRVHLGQWEFVSRECSKWPDKLLEHTLSELADIHYTHLCCPDTAFGICAPEVSDDAKIAHDISDAICGKLPALHLGSEPMAEVAK